MAPNMEHGTEDMQNVDGELMNSVSTLTTVETMENRNPSTLKSNESKLLSIARQRNETNLDRLRKSFTVYTKIYGRDAAREALMGIASKEFRSSRQVELLELVTSFDSSEGSSSNMHPRKGLNEAKGTRYLSYRLSLGTVSTTLRSSTSSSPSSINTCSVHSNSPEATRFSQSESPNSKYASPISALFRDRLFPQDSVISANKSYESDTNQLNNTQSTNENSIHIDTSTGELLEEAKGRNGYNNLPFSSEAGVSASKSVDYFQSMVYNRTDSFKKYQPQDTAHGSSLMNEVNDSIDLVDANGGQKVDQQIAVDFLSSSTEQHNGSLQSSAFTCLNDSRNEAPIITALDSEDVLNYSPNLNQTNESSVLQSHVSRDSPSNFGPDFKLKGGSNEALILPITNSTAASTCALSTSSTIHSTAAESVVTSLEVTDHQKQESVLILSSSSTLDLSNNISHSNTVFTRNEQCSTQQIPFQSTSQSNNEEESTSNSLKFTLQSIEDSIATSSPSNEKNSNSNDIGTVELRSSPFCNDSDTATSLVPKIASLVISKSTSSSSAQIRQTNSQSSSSTSSSLDRSSDEKRMANHGEIQLSSSSEEDVSFFADSATPSIIQSFTSTSSSEVYFIRDSISGMRRDLDKADESRKRLEVDAITSCAVDKAVAIIEKRKKPRSKSHKATLKHCGISSSAAPPPFTAKFMKDYLHYVHELGNHR